MKIRQKKIPLYPIRLSLVYADGKKRGQAGKNGSELSFSLTNGKKDYIIITGE